MATTESRARRRPRPWIIPPATARPSHPLLRGAEILSEIPGALGVVLWLLHRDLELSAGVAPEHRANLFRMTGLRAFERVSLPRVIEEHVGTIIQTLASIHPSGAAASAAAIADWAEQHAPRTALLFAETAAHAEPGSARYARRVGLFALSCGLAPQGESWLRRAVAIARRGRDWSSYAHLYADLAELAERAGAVGVARKRFRRALVVYRRHTLAREIRARAALGLFRLALGEGDLDRADHFAAFAMRTLRGRRAPGARADVARAFLEAGEYGRVLAIANADTLAAARRGERLALAGIAARAAAALGDPECFDAAWRSFVAAADAAAGQPGVANQSARAAEIRETVAGVLQAVADTADCLGTILSDGARLARTLPAPCTPNCPSRPADSAVSRRLPRTGSHLP